MTEITAQSTTPDPRRKLIVCCDGTWNQPFKGGKPTNVVKMVNAIEPVDDKGKSQLVYYHPGVGTGNLLDRFVGGTMGVGLSASVQSAYQFLSSNYVDGDLIFLFGFSRGAFTVRSLGGLIGLVGLLDKKDMDLFEHVYDIYRSVQYRSFLSLRTRDEMRDALKKKFSNVLSTSEFERLLDALLTRSRPAPIFFIGVWDTVGSLGIPGGLFRWLGRSMYQFHNTDLSDQVRYAYHALAVDEARTNFKPTLWTRPKGRGDDASLDKQTLEQVWFAGAHSNVGGGYPDCALSDIAFLWMVSKAASAALEEDSDSPLTFNEDYLAEKIEKTMGLLVDSRRGIWKFTPGYVRPVLADPPTGGETCESIHYSVVVRYRSKDRRQYQPYPYAPANLRDTIERVGVVAQLMDLEKRFRPWP